MIKTYRSASVHQVLKIRERYMLHGKTSEQEYCLYLRDNVSERMYIFYMFPYKSIVIGALTLEIIFSAWYQTNRYLLHML